MDDGDKFEQLWDWWITNVPEYIRETVRTHHLCSKDIHCGTWIQRLWFRLIVKGVQYYLACPETKRPTYVPLPTNSHLWEWILWYGAKIDPLPQYDAFGRCFEKTSVELLLRPGFELASLFRLEPYKDDYESLRRIFVSNNTPRLEYSTTKILQARISKFQNLYEISLTHFGLWQTCALTPQGMWTNEHYIFPFFEYALPDLQARVSIVLRSHLISSLNVIILKYLGIVDCFPLLEFWLYCIDCFGCSPATISGQE